MQNDVPMTDENDTNHDDDETAAEARRLDARIAELNALIAHLRNRRDAAEQQRQALVDDDADDDGEPTYPTRPSVPLDGATTASAVLAIVERHDGVSADHVLNMAHRMGHDRNDARDALDRLKRQGEVYESESGLRRP